MCCIEPFIEEPFISAIYACVVYLRAIHKCYICKSDASPSHANEITLEFGPHVPHHADVVLSFSTLPGSWYVND